MPSCPDCQRAVPEGAAACPACGAAPVAPAPPVAEAAGLVGTTVAGRYFVHRLLGRGGMATVYQATEVALDRPVALKILGATTAADPARVRRFQREAEAAGRLRHPNTVAVLDAGQAGDGTSFIAMELVTGPTLARVVAEGGPLPEARALRLGAELLSALEAAHAAGIVHRDLKPANVMLAPLSDGGERVKVVDFGIAAVAAPSGQDDAERLTQHGLVFGTPDYMSPEQIRGEPLDARSDLYAAGALLYELLTGVPPFQGTTGMALAARHLTEPAPPLHARRPDVSAATAALVARALEKDREARPPTAAAMRAALVAALAGLPASAGPSGPALPPTEALPAQGGGPAPAPAWSKASAPSAQARPARRPGRALAAGAAAALLLAVAAARWLVPAEVPPPRVANPAATAAVTPAAAAAPAPAAAAPLQVLGPAPGAPSGAGPASATPPRSPRAQAVARPASDLSAPAPRPAPAPPGPQAGPAVPTSSAPPAIRLVRGELNSIPTPPTASGEGVLVLVANPWAEVSIDGAPVGETPREVRLAAGSYEVRATHPELGQRSDRVTVAPGERKLWTATFGP